MRIGVTLPTNEIGGDRIAIRDFAQAAEALGYTHILGIDHVVGANRGSRPGWQGYYDHTNVFDEPFVLLGYIAGVAPGLELGTGIVILPQRQTVLVAKQTAEIDVLCGGRFRFGVGLGWNDVEYEALGQDFHTRAARMEEQIELLRLLWANELVTFKGRWDTITDAGLNPLPPRRSIPIWFGSISSEQALRRMARLGDGWLPILPPDEKTARVIERLRSYVQEAGRDPAAFGIDPMIGVDDMVNKTPRRPEDWARDAEWWKAQGATHCSLFTVGAGLKGADAHIEAIRKFRDLVPEPA